MKRIYLCLWYGISKCIRRVFYTTRKSQWQPLPARGPGLLPKAIFLLSLALFMLLNTKTLDEGFFVLNNEAYAQPALSHLPEVLYELGPSELSLCISFVRNPDMDSRQIADFVFTWNPEKQRKTIASVFRTKITKLTERLRRIDYEQLIIDIDLIKNSHLTTAQLIGLIKNTRRR